MGLIQFINTLNAIITAGGGGGGGGGAPEEILMGDTETLWGSTEVTFDD